MSGGSSRGAAAALAALALLGLGAVAAPDPGGVPADLLRYFTPEEVARGAAYTSGRYWLFGLGTLLRLVALALLVFTPASAALRGLAVRLAPARPAAAVALYLALLVLGAWLLTLPLAYYAGFAREHAFGLSTQTPSAWWLDRGKGLLLTLVLAVPAGSLLILLWRRYPGRWLLPAWGLTAAALILLVALAPVVIDPLFHTIRPVTDPGLRQRVLALAERAGLPVEEVYVTDASRRTRRANAYFTGLGTTRRIVLYDTLLERSDPGAVELVLAHEMAHWQHAHIWKGIGLSLLGLGAALWCGARLLDWAGRRRLFRLAGPADVAGLPLLLLLLLCLSLASLPLQNGISRHFEREADWTSLTLTRDPAAFVRAEVDLARANLAHLTPPPLIVALLYTHPPVMERIRMAEAFPDSDGPARPAGSP